MKIRAKLLLGFSAMMLIMLVLTTLAYNQMSTMNEKLEMIYNERYQNYKNAQNMRGQVNKVARYVANAMIPGQTNSAANMMRLEESVAVNKELAVKLRETSTIDEQEQQLTYTGASLAQQFNTYADEVIRLTKAGKVEEAIALRTATGLGLQERFLELAEQLMSYEENKMDSAYSDSSSTFRQSIQWLSSLTLLGLLIGMAIVLWTTISITRGINVVNLLMSGFSKGKLKALSRVKVTSKDELGEVATVFKKLAVDLEERNVSERKILEEKEAQTWIKTHVARLTEVYGEITDLSKLAQTFSSEFTPVLGASFGAVYIVDEHNEDLLRLHGTYGFNQANGRQSLMAGDGLAGQALRDNRQILLKGITSEHIRVTSALSEALPASVVVQPVRFEDKVLGVIEMGKMSEFTSLELDLLSQLADSTGFIMNRIIGRMKVEDLLRESQTMTEELQAQSEELMAQQEELRVSNEKLEQHTHALMKSEDLLQRQQADLEHSNEELVMKTQLLQEQIKQTDTKHHEVELQRQSLEKQALELALASKYKTEFLANMSHELRTPLNSLLILSQLLADNKEGNLNDKQLEYAQTIHGSGSDLLKLIDEILDLSKVETGKMDVYAEPLQIQSLVSYVERNFGPVASDKKIDFQVKVDAMLPPTLYTDTQRLKQILKNLLSNAFKFTNLGYVSLSMEATGDQSVRMIVRDSGIGIPQEKQELIFEAFRQADGTTSRKYGGTGLGLSISRELAKLLHGNLEVESIEGQGSTFILTIPLQLNSSAMQEAAASVEQPIVTVPLYHEVIATIESGKGLSEAPMPSLEDDRADLNSEDRVILIVEDDVNFAKILMDMARNRGFKVITAQQGDQGLSLAKMYTPDAILLDIQLPVMDGWSILHHLKNAAETRHIPVHVISVADEIHQGLTMGAMAFLKKPSERDRLEQVFSEIEGFIERNLRKLLIVESDIKQCKELVDLIGHDDIMITEVHTGEEAIEILRNQQFDCMVLDMELTDISGFELLDLIRASDELKGMPIIIHVSKEMDKYTEVKLKRYAEAIIIKDVRTPERLLDETMLFLHRIEADLPLEKREMLRRYQNKEAIFDGKRILLVDDDIRNVFAISSVLEAYGMQVSFAENGREALEQLNTKANYDLVLMDIMMPEMDGYEAMQNIREMPKYSKLPIIALTAKAMKDDRQKCIEAGASDYVIKPIQPDQLLSLMRVWLYK
ncbi:histidine kinase [Paenibacillus swuensis]|uniref:Circadian input-output histidine kinase CikA n=1 Tax=Paenibacillus swuensis TaxID=1178515 RepID=A0A172TMA6_9BACL|nr:response regulator [Paenibacillus swuensis]ANE48112.1 histidine kinase [Paenibacillus swuensis]